MLDSIQGHQDLVGLSAVQRSQLCREIREYLVQNISKTGGHVSSNLGVVELTVAVETVFDTVKDRLVFDVGHQSYVHKILTGRQADFATLRQFGGLAGFPKPSESITDSFTAGHASTSVSIALGMARARTLQKEDYSVVVLIGDGAATGGTAFEGLNDAAVSGEPVIIILNDNALSIDRNVGGMASHLQQLRTKERYLGMKEKYRNTLFRIPGGRSIYTFTRSIKDRIRRMLIPTTIFESMGFTYLGPVDGHDTEHLINLLRIAKAMRRPVVLHVITQKGRGYGPAEEHPKLFHGIGKFDPETGEPFKKNAPTFSESFGRTMVQLASENDKICAITAAMPGGTGLLEFKSRFSNRLFDVGIAEEHAVSMAGGLAKQGMIPVVAIYSTFLQRAYDMLLQDICMQKLHVVFAVDRAGLVGEDGETHHGIYDVGFLRHCPGMKVLCPGSMAEQRDMLCWAVKQQDGPVAIRYPRGGDRGYTGSAWDGKNMLCCHRRGEDVTIVTYGTMVENAMDAAAIAEEHGIRTGVIRLLTVTEVSAEELSPELPEGSCVVFAEEVSGACAVAGQFAWELKCLRPDLRIDCVNLGEGYVQHGDVATLYEHYGLSAKKLACHIQEVHQSEN